MTSGSRDLQNVGMTEFGKGRPYSISDAEPGTACSWDLYEFSRLCAACVASAASLEFSSVYADVKLDMKSPETPPATKNALSKFFSDIMSQASTELNRNFVQNTVSFTQSTLFCRLVDSFEWHLRMTLRRMLEINPKLMQSRTQANSPEFSVGLDMVLRHFESDFSHFKDAVIEKYLDSLLTGPAYLKAIDFIEAKLNRRKQIVPDDQMAYLKALFALRNTITHENGRLDDDSLAFIFGGKEHVIKEAPLHSTHLLVISERLCGYSLAIEQAIPPQMKHQPALTANAEMIFETLRHAWAITELLVNRP